VNCFDPSDPDRTDERERGNLTVVARVPVVNSGKVAVLEWMTAMLQMFLGAMKRLTRSAVMRRCRMWGQRACALPGTAKRSGWSDGVLQGALDALLYDGFDVREDVAVFLGCAGRRGG
jgi:hypothetical protein